MASDPNNRRGDVNSIGGGQSRFMEELARLDSRARMQTAEMHRIQEEVYNKTVRLGELTDHRFAAQRAQAGQRIGRDVFENLGVAKNEINKIMRGSQGEQANAYASNVASQEGALLKSLWEQERQLESREKQMQVGGMRGFRSSVASLTRSPNLDIETRRQAGNSVNSARGRILAGNMRDTELDKRIEVNKSQQREYATQLQDVSELVGTKEGRGEYENIAGRLGNAQSRGGELIAAREHHRRSGTDINGVLDSGGSLVERIAKRERSAGIANYVSSSNLDPAKEGQKLSKMGQEVTNAFDAMNKAIASGAENADELRSKMEHLSKSYKDQEDVVGELDSRGGRRPPSMLSRFSSVLGGVAGVGSAIADVMQYANVNSNNAQVSLRGQIAGATNTRYFDALSGLHGDMSALRRSDTFQFDRSARQGMGVAGLQQNVLDLRTANSLIDAGATVSGSIADSQSKASGIINSTIAVGSGTWNGLVGAAPSLASAAISRIDRNKRISSSSAALERFSSQNQLEDALNAIPDAAKQRLFDTSSSVFGSMQGFGAGASSAFSQVMSNSSMRAMAKLGMGASDTASLMGHGANLMGADFGGMPVVARAAQLQQSRMMSGDAYMSAVGQMTSVGGGQGNVEEMLANAVARGVDNSKNFTGMINAVTSLASKDASRGIDVSMGTQHSFMSGITALDSSGLNEQMKQAAALSGVNRANELTGNMGMNFPSIVKLARVSNAFKDLSRAGRAGAAALNTSQTGQLEGLISGGANINKIRSTAAQLSVSELLFNENGGMRSDALSRLEQLQGFNLEQGVGNTSGISSAHIKKILETTPYDKLSPALQDMVNSNLGWGLGGAAGLATLQGGKFNTKFDPRHPNLAATRTLTGGAADVKNINAIGAMGDAKQIGEIEDQMHALNPKGGSALHQISAQMQRVLERTNLKDGEGRTLKAAGEMNLAAGKLFDTSVGHFKDAVDHLVANAGGAGGTLLVNKLNDALTKLQHLGGGSLDSKTVKHNAALTKNPPHSTGGRDAVVPSFWPFDDKSKKR